MSWSTHNNQRRAERARALTAQLDRVARIHSGRVRAVDLSTNPTDPAPGWSTEGYIWLSQSLLPDPVSVDDVAVWLGVLMHEVGHCDVSPKTVEGANHRVYNLAEDPREEALQIARLPGVVGSLTQAVGRLILEHPSATPRGLWPLIAGRTYLPVELRRKVEAAARADMGSKWVAEVADLIAQYMRLSDPGYSEADEAREILLKLGALLDAVPPEEYPVQQCGSQGSADPPIGGVEISPEDILDGADGEDDGGEEGDDEGGGGGTGAGDGDDEAEEDDGDTGDGAGGGAGGAGAGDGIGDEIREEAEKAAQPDAETRRQAKIILRRMREESHRQAGDRTRTGGKSAPSPEARGAVARLNRHLKPLIDAAEAGLDRMEPAGRIRPDRIAAGYRPDHVFDKWRLDQDDAVSAEIVVAVDTSGSMSGHAKDLSEAVWILRSVVGKTAANLTVISWNSDAGIVKTSMGRTVDNLVITGGTYPIPMLDLATDIFSKSRMRRKWLLVMTDGDVHVGAAGAAEKMTQRLIENGVTVSAIEFGTHANATVFGENRQRITNLSEIPEMVGAMLRRVYRSNVAR